MRLSFLAQLFGHPLPARRGGQREFATQAILHHEAVRQRRAQRRYLHQIPLAISRVA